MKQKELSSILTLVMLSTKAKMTVQLNELSAMGAKSVTKAAGNVYARGAETVTVTVTATATTKSGDGAVPENEESEANHAIAPGNHLSLT
jgi:hypothetical protein